MDTIESGIHRLDKRVSARSLEGLETRIWAGAAARKKANEVSRLVVSCQIVLMIVAMIGSITAGAVTGASEANPHQELAGFSGRTDLAPSTLLLGSYR